MRSAIAFQAAAVTALLVFPGPPASAQRRTPKDLSGVRGFNYQSAPTTGHAEHWLQYSAAETERDFSIAGMTASPKRYRNRLGLEGADQP